LGFHGHDARRAEDAHAAERARKRSKSRKRDHSTFGIDQKVLPWDVFGTFPEGNWFRLTGAVDLARDYLGWAVAIGVWH
jgi:hypothetical protein